MYVYSPQADLDGIGCHYWLWWWWHPRDGYDCDNLLLQAALHNRLLSENLESSSYPGYENYPPWLLQLLSLDQDTQVGIIALAKTPIYFSDNLEHTRDHEIIQDSYDQESGVLQQI